MKIAIGQNAKITILQLVSCSLLTRKVKHSKKNAPQYWKAQSQPKTFDGLN